MKKTLFLFLATASLILVFTGCKPSFSDPDPTPSDTPAISGEVQGSGQETHSHTPLEGSNILEHEEMLYCGNTMTTVYYHPEGKIETAEWEKSFDGNESVALTDLLRYLDYSGDVCRCLPEYTVDTEFGEGYGVNLTSGYARHGGGQVELTQVQIDEVQEIMDRLSAE